MPSGRMPQTHSHGTGAGTACSSGILTIRTNAAGTFAGSSAGRLTSPGTASTATSWMAMEAGPVPAPVPWECVSSGSSVAAVLIARTFGLISSTAPYAPITTRYVLGARPLHGPRAVPDQTDQHPYEDRRSREVDQFRDDQAGDPRRRRVRTPEREQAEEGADRCESADHKHRPEHPSPGEVASNRGHELDDADADGESDRESDRDVDQRVLGGPGRDRRALRVQRAHHRIVVVKDQGRDHTDDS